MTKSTVPNIFTFSNLACGILSIIMTLSSSLYNPSNYKWACIFILTAAFLDRYDGRVARFLNVTSEIGKELDSLADLVSFGVAPSILVFSLYNLDRFGLIGYLLVLIFPISGAYRLARYNCSNFNGIFMGVPITVAGTFIALYSLIIIFFGHHILNPVFPALFLILLSYLMVSKFKIKKV